MSRIAIIARREFLAYARTVGFWLSLLSFPIFGAIGGAVPLLMHNSEPVRAVALVEQPGGEGLAQAVAGSIRAGQDRRYAAALRSAAVTEAGQDGADRVRATAETQGREAGLAALRAAAPRAASGFKPPRQSMRLVDAPADIRSALPGAAQDMAVRRYLTDAAPEGQRLSAVVLLGQDQGRPAARVWTARATDDTVEDAVRDALKSVNRDRSFAAAGIDRSVVEATDAFRPEVKLFSPKAAAGAEVSFRDKLPAVIGLAFGFILWSLIITGASILMNSVMEEKSNKILEVLLSSASATEILTGKVLGVALLTLTVLLVWGGLGAAGLLTALPKQAADIGSVLLHGGLLIYFALYMVGGYMMYAVLFAAIGAFCETPRDAQTLMGPIMMVLVVPLIVMQMALQTPDAPLVRILSWVPLFTPFLMSARAPSDPPMWEIVGTTVGMFAMAALMVWLAGRAFRAGALSDVKLSWKSFGAAIRGGGR